MTNTIELSIIIVSFNTKKLLEECLSSVFNSLKSGNFTKNREVIVVDNASSDNSVSMILEKFHQVKIIKNSSNLGFGAGNNQGIKIAKGEYVLLLNSDTILFKNTIKDALTTIKKDKEIGVLGVKLLNENKTVQQSVGFFPTPLRILNWMFFIDGIPVLQDLLKPYHLTSSRFYNSENEVDWVTGAFFLLRKAATIKDLFDEKMFMYVEEVEFCYRIKKNGWKILYTPLASAIHKKGGSGKGDEAGLVEEFQGLAYFYKKHYLRVSQIFLKLSLLLGALLRVVVFAIIRPNREKKELYRKYFTMAG